MPERYACRFLACVTMSHDCFVQTQLWKTLYLSYSIIRSNTEHASLPCRIYERNPWKFKDESVQRMNRRKIKEKSDKRILYPELMSEARSPLLSIFFQMGNQIRVQRNIWRARTPTMNQDNPMFR
jgi:hypothetical protein